MRWLLRWLLDDLQRLLNPRAGELARLPGGMARARRRHAWHRAQAREASERTAQLLQRVKALEMSPEAPLDELVTARRELMAAEADLRHHRSRAAGAEEALRLMREDRGILEAGGQARHRDRYAHLLNP